MAGDVTQTEEQREASARHRARELLQRAADAYWEIVCPNEAAHHEYRMGFYVAAMMAEEGTLPSAEGRKRG